MNEAGRRRLDPAEVLRLARRLHAADRLAEAEPAYRHVLAQTPHDRDALSGLGALSLALGRPLEAETLLRRALATGPASAETCNALGVTLAALNRPAEAREQYRRAVAIDPAHVAARNNLGAALLAAGSGVEALAHFEAAVALDPARAEPHNNLGNALAALGRLSEALAPYERALALRPDFVEARFNCGLALAALGRTEDAAQAFELTLALRPDHTRARAGLARALGRLERYEEAVHQIEQAVGEGSASAEMHNDHGAFLAALGRHEDAVAPFRAAIALNPAYAAAHNNLGNALAALDRYEEAVDCYKTAFGLDPLFSEAYANLGGALAELHHPADALPWFERALALDPGVAQTHHHRAQALVALGDVAQARASFERAIALQPDRTEFYNGLAGVAPLGPDDPHFLAMRALIEKTPSMNETERTQLHFALAKAYEDQGRQGQAFLHLSAGNSSRRRRIAYDEAATLARMGRFSDVMGAEWLPRAPPRGTQPDLPIFIVGMPRSGSTLVEQILASHAEVFGAGELMLFAQETERALGESADFLEAIKHLDFAALGARYRERLRALAPGVPNIVDKQLSNFQYLGLIRMALPDARIIHTRRDPVDTCLSCFAQTFSAGFGYSNDLGDLGRYYRRYAEIMAHWRAVLPQDAMLEVHYEDLVADFEPQARRILDYCGLPWDARCLAFHETPRPVITASAAQVRRPIYRTSSGRARGYGRLLDPLRDALGQESSTA